MLPRQNVDYTLKVVMILILPTKSTIVMVITEYPALSSNTTAVVFVLVTAPVAAVSPVCPSAAVVVTVLVVLPCSSEVGEAMMDTGRSWTSG